MKQLNSLIEAYNEFEETYSNNYCVLDLFFKDSKDKKVSDICIFMGGKGNNRVHVKQAIPELEQYRNQYDGILTNDYSGVPTKELINILETKYIDMIDVYNIRKFD